VRRVTSVDIAKKAGVSRTTVSFVINGRMDLAVAPETRKRVLKAAEELGYVPNAPARVLLTGRTQTIAICVQSLNDPHYSPLLNLLLLEARRRGYHSLVVSGQDDSVPLLVAEGRVDGILVVGDFFWEPNFKSQNDKPAPVVCVGGYDNTTLQDWPITYVYWNDRKGGALATRHLLARGHSHIALMLGTSNSDNLKARGYRQAMDGAGRKPLFVRCEDEGDLFAAGRQMMEKICTKHRQVTAIFCRHDLFAVGALAWAAENGISVPGDMSLIGYNNIPLTANTVPQLTTIATPVNQAGLQALDILLEQLAPQNNGSAGKTTGDAEKSGISTGSPPRHKSKRIELPLKLIERSSAASLQSRK
jgi:LacI family transcriptional regulator